MANGHGGKRTPANPAPVSGPGQYSARTDGQAAQYISDQPYGEGQALMDLQRSAPMAASAPASTPAAAGPSAAAIAPLTPFGAATERPMEPLTTGNPMGPGPGPEVLSRPADDPRAKLRAYLPILIRMADLPETSAAARNQIRYLRGVL